MKGKFIKGVPTSERYRESARSRKAAERREGRKLVAGRKQLVAAS